MATGSLPNLLVDTPLNLKIRNELEAPEGEGVVVSTPLLSRNTPDSRQLSRLDKPNSDADRHCSLSSFAHIHEWCVNRELLFHRLRLLQQFIGMHVDMGFDGNTLVGLGLKGMPGHQWLLRISILGPQLCAWYFLSKNGMSGHQTLLLISVCPFFSFMLGLILQPGMLHSMITFAFCLSLEPTRLLIKCWNGGEATELIWFSIADGLVEAPISAFLTLVPAMVLTQTEGEEVPIVWCASVLWGLFTTAWISTELHFYGEKPSLEEKLRMSMLVKFPGVVSQVLGYIFFAYLTRCSIEGVPWLTGIEYVALVALLCLELTWNFSILKATCERLPLEVALLFSCVMCVAGPPAFLQKLDQARWPHAVQHTALTIFMAVCASLISPSFSQRAVLLPMHYLIFVVLYLASVLCSLVAACMTADRKLMRLEDAAQQTQARFTEAVKSKDRIMINLLMSVEGATPRIVPDLLETSDSSSSKWAGICYSSKNGKLYCAPACSSAVLVIDPKSDTLSCIETGSTMLFKWRGISEAENGKLYCPPDDHSAVLVIDPLAEKLSFIETGLEGADKWVGIATASNGKLYCAPHRQSDVLVIDPSTNTTKLIATGVEGEAKWRGIAAAANGKAYCAPFDHDSILVIDSATDCVSFIATEATGFCKWNDITEARNGKLYCAPFRHSSILVIDPATDCISYIETYEQAAGKWRGIASSLDAKLYCAPYDHSTVLVLDTRTEKAEFIDTGMAVSGKLSGITACPNGTMYCAPYTNGGVLKVDPGTIANWDQRRTLRELGLLTAIADSYSFVLA